MSAASTWFVPAGLEARARAGLSPMVVSEIAAKLWAARKRSLAGRPVAEIVELIDAAVESWLAPDSPWMAEAARGIAAGTPYCEQMVRTGLGRLLAGCRKEPLLKLLTEELGDPEVLDAFRPRPAAGGSHRAMGPGLITYVFSGNVPGLPAIGLIQALLLKSSCLGKPASEEPIFPALFARSLAALDADLASTIAIVPWAGGDQVIENAAFGLSDAVVAYGSDAAIASLRTRVPPAARFIGHGHKLSFAVIGREALAPEAADALADRLAYDVSLFDQQGCVSAHLVYVERGGGLSPDVFAERLAVAMASFDLAMPRGRVTLAETAAIQQARTAVEMQELRGEPARLFASEGGTAWTVAYEADPIFTPSCLNRVVRVKAIADISDLTNLLKPVSRYLQTVGVAMAPSRRDRLAGILARMGACRICPIGEMPHPPLAWHHDSGSSLLPLVRWIGIDA
jgi:hypothetical protein